MMILRQTNLPKYVSPHSEKRQKLDKPREKRCVTQTDLQREVKGCVEAREYRTSELDCSHPQSAAAMI